MAKLRMLPPRIATARTSRLSAAARGYDRTWEAAAAVFKKAHRWCIGCAALGIRTPTAVIDHVRPHRGDQELFWMRTNWQAACAWHHDAIKARLEVMWEKREIADADLRLDSAFAVDLAKRVRDGRGG